MPLDPELLAILVCPVCRSSLEVEGENEGLACTRCALVYPVREDIPVLLAEEGVPLRQWNGGIREANAAVTVSKNTK